LTTRIAEQKELFNKLIDQLPRCDYFELYLNHRITNWLPFYWRGFKQTTRYTYILDDLSSTEAVWKGLRAEVRTQIRKAERQLSVRTDLSIDQLLDVVELTFRRQGRQLPFTRELVRRIDEACLQRGARHAFFAMDADRRLHAALYMVRDAEYAYYLLGGADPRLRSSGAQLLLFWEAIRLAATLNLKFDFEGSMIEPIERVFRAFGAVQVPYMKVYGARPLAQVLLLMRELLLT
jgi:lipid II:glycine glycyltransferase (peptidoglycan interpeptide bridge formation enzyme)